MVWSVILCSRSATRESQTDLRAAGRRPGGRGLAWSGEDWRWRGRTATRGDSTGRRIRLECVTLWKERQAAEGSCLPSGTGVRAAYSRVTVGCAVPGGIEREDEMGTDMQEMVDVAFSQRDGLRDWHGLEMDAPERLPAGGMAKAWHNDMPFVTETWRGTGC